MNFIHNNDIYIKEVQGVQYNKDIFTLMVYITDKCNLSCKYCYNTFPRSDNEIKLQYIIQLLNIIFRYQKYKKIELQIIGGEPTLCTNLLYFCSTINKKFNNRVNIIIFSNFTQPIQMYNQLLDNNVYLILTLHNNKIYNNFFDKLQQIDKNKRKSLVYVSIMYEPYDINNSLKAFDTLCNMNNEFNRIQLSLINENENFKFSYTNNQLDQYKKREKFITASRIQLKLSNNQIKIINDNFFFKSHINQNFYRWYCETGVQHMYVHVDGQIYLCDNTVKDSHIGNIYKLHNFQFPTHGIFCKSKHCPCIFDVLKKNVFKLHTPFNNLII